MAKEIYVKHGNFLRNYYTIYRATVETMVNEIFGYTLECGHSWRNSIIRYPKKSTSLVNALNESANATRRYNDYYELVTKEEYDSLEEKEFVFRGHGSKTIHTK